MSSFSSWVKPFQPFLDLAKGWLLLRGWSLYKYALHRWTGQCELERIARATPATATPQQHLQQHIDISHSLRRSNQLYTTLAPIYGTQAMTRKRYPITHTKHVTSDKEEENTAAAIVRTIIRVKRLREDELTTQVSVMPALTTTLTHILAINRLIHHIDTAKSTPYSEANPTHEKLLMSLWDTLQPHKPLTARKSKDWELLGFQGENPATDFRGMGILGLYQLIAFARTCGLDAGRLLSESRKGGLRMYSFAITGINLTADLVLLTRERVLDEYFFRYGASVQSFNALYCSFFVRFHEAWIKANPRSVMEFSHIHDEFLREVRRQAPYAHREHEGYEFLSPLVAVDKFDKQKWE